MKFDDFEIISEGIQVDDTTLHKLLQESKEKLAQRENYYKDVLQRFNEENYGSYVVAKLSRDFAHEEYQQILSEVERRRELCTKEKVVS